MNTKYSEFVRDRDGKIIRKSRNMAGIRRHVSEGNFVKKVAISEIGERKQGRLYILFNNGDSYESNLWQGGASYILQVVLQWRNLHGAPLRYNDTDFEAIDPKNKTLKVLAGI